MERRVRINDSKPVGERFAPIPHLNITATTIGAAEVLFTVREPVVIEVKRLSAINTTGGLVTLALFSVPSGGSASAANAELWDVDLPGNTAADLTDFIGGLYEAGTTLQVYSSVSGAITIHGFVRELLWKSMLFKVLKYPRGASVWRGISRSLKNRALLALMSCGPTLRQSNASCLLSKATM